MTDTEAKALALVNEICGSSWLPHEIERIANFKALCHYIEATEARHAAELREQAERFEAFRQEVSDAIKSCMLGPIAEERLTPFILPAPDPLVAVMNEMGFGMSKTAAEEFRAAMQARGYEVRKIGEAGE